MSKNTKSLHKDDDNDDDGDVTGAVNCHLSAKSLKQVNINQLLLLVTDIPN